MSFIWLAAWLFRRRPSVRMFRQWNDWGIALGVCLVIDLVSGMGRTAGVGGRKSRKFGEPGKSVAVPTEAKRPVPAVP